ncbi:hypothetical protein SAMN03097699_0678 [Flavobacteriaceae bacterium MAR_2010_188]|nr:hypothetical protein SAMN03097699_0678 [Flavobacteriaceae bacterium MAR_2010_188]
MEKNKFSKPALPAGRYLLYAIGEILLVVFGILIALSINNWNDNRKDRIAENELYKTLIESLEGDLVDVRAKTKIIDSAIVAQSIFITESLDTVTSRFSDAEIFDLINKVGYTSYSFVPNISLYNKIVQNNEIDLIQSEELQRKVIDMYEVQYWEYKDLDNTLERLAQEGLVSNFFGDISHLYITNTMEINPESFAEHYEQLGKDCRKIYFLSNTVRKSMLNCENKIQALLPLLREELKK